MNTLWLENTCQDSLIRWNFNSNNGRSRPLTDGRYFIQAANQLEGSSITLYKMGEEGVPTTIKFLKDKLEQNQSLAFDGG